MCYQLSLSAITTGTFLLYTDASLHFSDDRPWILAGCVCLLFARVLHAPFTSTLVSVPKIWILFREDINRDKQALYLYEHFKKDLPDGLICYSCAVFHKRTPTEMLTY
ncbi:hypothetical protein C7974DRAFT_111584 [Boeremia exigua]|uniref:uncharacterized protein n=1 Tax=Boeremia exigua TaxID=749465 RepID=UPI001E8E7262|nr:uncharacterized protein C7974DRAFT_111584 [Boeremia exigua]KAH6642832.1 hypothetical protein C7974DRAFT_111584 [Boeremia exigua]